MALNVGREMKALEDLTVPELRQRYAEVFGEPSRCRHKRYLIKRILWRMQANEHGDLSERARRRAAELANDADLRLCPPKAPPARSGGQTVVGTVAPPADGRLPVPGTILTREYRGQTIRVMVLEKGFEYAGDLYRSLTAVAEAVTGSHWNGYGFFGLRKAKARQ